MPEKKKQTDTQKMLFLHHLQGNINEGKRFLFLFLFCFFSINQSFYLKHHESKPQLHFVSLDLRCRGLCVLYRLLKHCVQVACLTPSVNVSDVAEMHFQLMKN